MARVIPHEAMTYLLGALGEDGAIGIAVEGVDQTPAGPRVRFVVPRLRRARVNPKAVPERDTISELVSRMVAMRWRYGVAPRPVPAESSLALMAEHPEIYSGATETADGWHWLLATVAEWIKEGGVPDGFGDDQIKSKFGTLRFYCHGSDARTAKIVAAAEWLSGAVCEECGAPGSVRPGGWIRTLCDAHGDAKHRR
jgi:hypothetical protein